MKKATRKRDGARTNGKPDLKVGRATIDVFELKESPENAQLYRDRSMADFDFARLAQSVGEKGVQQPLLVSRDRYILSGHQRRRAAIETGKFKVPIIVLNIRRDQHTPEEWLALLREYNTGRQKTFDELVREKLVDINPDEAVQQIVSDQIHRTSVRVSTIDISDATMKRAGISQAKRGMADAILSILEMLKDYLPVSLRAIHYRLLNEVVWRNSETELRYVNDKGSYKDLRDLATRMRLAGEIEWDAISDETRPVTEWSCWKSGADFIGQKSDRFLTGYARDLLQSQPKHLEVVAEKLTVQNFITPVAMKYRMPVVIMRGNSSIDARRQISKRFRASGKKELFLFCLGDCDADGDSIVDSTLRSMRDDFCVGDVDGTRVAMTHQQADSLRLPKMLDAKTTSSNYRKFVAKHGRSDAYELEAVQPEVLQRWLDTAIRGVIDVEAFNHEVEAQSAEAADILARRKAVLEMMMKCPS